MAQFSYTAKNRQAEVIRDTILAASRQEALTLLRKRGLTVVTLTDLNSLSESSGSSKSKASKPANSQHSAIPFWKRPLVPASSRKVKLKDMAIFCRQLAISVNSGLPLRDALTGIHEDMDVPSFKLILGDILDRLHDGVSFSKAAAAHPKVFFPVFIGLIRAAEESGSMGETMTRLANYLESSDRLRRKIASLMAYPAFVAGFFILICMVMVFWIVPQFQEIFGDLGAELPLITRTVFSLNTAILNHAPLIAVVLILIAVAVYLYSQTRIGRLQLAKNRLSMPIIGECVKQYAIARVCRCLAIMLKGGVPIATALQIVSKVSSNQIIENSLVAARNQTVGGSNIADSLADTKIFPSLLIRMVRVGESAGRLPDVLDNVASTYEDMVENTITAAVALLEPVIIVVFGAFVLMLVIAIYMPIMTVASHI